MVYMSLPTAIVVDDSTVDTELGPAPLFSVRVVFSMIDGCRALFEAYWSRRRRAVAGDPDCGDPDAAGDLVPAAAAAGSSLGGEGRGGAAAAAVNAGDGGEAAAGITGGVGDGEGDSPLPPLLLPETRRLRCALPASIVFLIGLSAMSSEAARAR